jgi:hypothetical protein
VAESRVEPLFHDVQPLRVRRLRWRLAILPIFLTTLAVLQVGFGRQWGKYPVSNGGLIFLSVLLWIVYLWLVRVRLEIAVTPGHLVVGLRGMFHRTTFPSADWAGLETISFDAARDFGGYGLRRTGATRTYVASGTRGVRLTLRDGGIVVVGTDRPDDLVAALNRARSPR